jgi:hypothetical protein
VADEFADAFQPVDVIAAMRGPRFRSLSINQPAAQHRPCGVVTVMW